MWYYLNQKNSTIGKKLYQQILDKYEEKLKKSFAALTPEKEEEAVVVILTGNHPGKENEMLDACRDANRKNQRVIVICTGEYGAENGMIPLYGEALAPKKVSAPLAEIMYKGQLFSCIMPRKLMPNVSQYEEIVEKLCKYKITDIWAEEGSVLGELLKRRIATWKDK